VPHDRRLVEILGVEGVRIAGISACVPANAVANDAKVAAATGIPARRVAPDGVSLLDLCCAAATRVMADTQARPEDFGAVLAVSFTQHERMPSLAAQTQARLGLPKSVLAFDVMQACAGWPYGLYLASLLARETGKKVLLLDGDRQSEFLDADDAATSPLLSDGATATVVEKVIELSNNRIIEFAFHTDGEKGAALRLEKGATIQMDGFGVFRFVATDVVEFLKRFVEETETLANNRIIECSNNRMNGASTFHSTIRHSTIRQFDNSIISFFVPHQPNVYMVRQLAKALGLEERTLISADRFGNLASASIPATIAANADAFAGRDARLLVSGFGGGLAISAARVDLPADCRLSVVEPGGRSTQGPENLV
jgi:3-oxoacyl-[acyl-carrier-protein] synthase III